MFTITQRLLLKHVATLFFALCSIIIPTSKAVAQCNVNQKYDKIVSGYHSSIALADNGQYLAWGQNIANDGASDQAGPPKAIIAANYPALTGTVLFTSIGGPGSGGKDQFVALTTTGLFAWGAEGSSAQGILSTSLTTSAAFALIATPTGGDATTKLPTGVTPSQVTMMVATFNTLAILANGNVWVLSLTDANMQGDGTTLAATTWHKVKISAGNDLTNVTTIRAQLSVAGTQSAMFALTSTGTAYTWGSSVYIGNNTAPSAKNYATQMTLPAEFTSSNIPKLIGVTGGSNGTEIANTYYLLSNTGALYSLGDNSSKQCGDFTTTERRSWVNVKRNATTNFTNVNFISVQEHTGKMAGAALITKTGDLYSWGDNNGNMLGRTSDGTINGTVGTTYDPGFPVGFTSGVDKAIFTEMGGHTLVYVKEGSSTFCYVGHRTNGSMGESTSSTGTVVSFDCTNTPSISLCGAVPVSADPTKSVISATPTTIAANGTSTSTINIQLKNSSGVNLTTTGGDVVVTTTDGTLGTVIDNNNGTYTVILTSSTNVNTATLGFSINGTTASGANSTTSVIFSGVPTITTSGSLSAFTSCTALTSVAQSFTISGTYLTANLIIGALTGYEYSLSSGGTYTSTLSLTPSSGTVANTIIYVRLSSIATNGAGGNIAITSSGATSQNIATGSATVNAAPTITLGSVASVSGTATSFNLPFTATTGSPDKYSITASTPAMSGFTAISNATLGSSPIAVTIPASSDNTYGFNISVTNSTTGCTSTNTSFNVVVNSSTIQFTSTPVLTVRARNQYLYSISAATTTNNAITFSDPTNSIPSWLALSSSAQTNGQQIGGTVIQPGAVTGDLNGNIYVVQNNGTGIYKITPNGTTTLFATRSSNGSTYGGALVIGHYLYISYYAGSYGMAQYDLNSPNPTGVNMLPGKSFLSMTYFNGFVYAASYSTSQIMKISIDEASPANSTSSIYITTPNVYAPFGLSFNSSGDLFVAEYGVRDIKKFANGSTTTSTIVQSGYTVSPSDVKIDANNNVYVSFSGLTNSIRKYTPDFSSFIDVSGTTKYVWGMSLNSNGTLFYGDYSNNKVFTLQTNATLLGAPQTPQVGQWPISLDAYDQVAHATQNFIINVLPNVPLPVSAQSAIAGDGSATITFTPPTDNGGASVTSYTVTSSPGNYSVTSSGSPVTITGLTNGTAYTFTIYATNSVGNSTNVTTSSVTPLAAPVPTGLTYSTPNVYIVGVAIGALSPTSTGGAITTYSVSPSLPTGLTLNTNTGLITGTPTAITAQSSYVVTGSNGSGTITTTVVISVNIAAPAGLSYTSPNVYTVGTAITSLNPTSTGGAISTYTVSPSLPAGLTLNTTTGIITGTPTSITPQASYVVTANNASGTNTSTIIITVNVSAPSGLNYTSPNVFTKSSSITALSPTSTGGTIATYSISPSLPAGLSFNTTTGIISGTPTSVSAQTSYLITGTNVSGNVTATIVITVNDNAQPPLPPVVISKKYIYNGSNLPTTLKALVTSFPVGTIPAWCTIGTLNCTTTPPTVPTAVGKYVYQIRTYDTTAQLYSTTFVNDTLIIAPPVPVVVDSTYVFGVATNPSNVSVLVSGLTGATFSYYYLGALQNSTPAIGNVFGAKKYAVSQTLNNIESDTSVFNVTLLDPANLIHLQKIVDSGILQVNSTYNYPFSLVVSNLTNTPFTNIILTDNLQNSVPITSDYSVVKNIATGGLIASNSFNGNSDINLTLPASILAPLAKDTSKFVINLVPKGYSGTLTNVAYVKANTKWGTIIMQSSSATKANETSKAPTNYYVKDLSISIPEGFSPNHDGAHDNFVIIKPYNVTLELEVFNRWGSIVYSNNNYKNDWDGKGTGNFAGKDLIDGGYYYSLRAVDETGKVQVFKGFVIIQR